MTKWVHLEQEAESGGSVNQHRRIAPPQSQADSAEEVFTVHLFDLKRHF